MPRLKEFPKEKKLEVLAQALAAEDLRKILTEGLHRRHILGISNWGLNGGIISQDDFNAIIGKIERPREFPRDPEQRLEALLSVGNTEPKQVLGLLLSDNPQSVEALRNQFISLIEGVQYKGKQWRPQVNTIESYLTVSLDRIGFVAFPIISRTEVCYSRTNAGKIYGAPVLAFTLHMTNQINFSMYNILGPTNTPGDSRAPYNRFRILEYLLKQKKQGNNSRVYDISSLINLNVAGVRGHLLALSAINFIDYDSAQTDLKGQFVYTWKDKHKTPESVPAYKKYAHMTLDVAKILFELEITDTDSITDHLYKKSKYSSKWKIKNLSHTICSILAHMVQLGFSDSVYKSLEQSHVHLRDEYLEFVEEFTKKLRDAMQDGKNLQSMLQIYKKYMEDGNIFRDNCTSGSRFYLEVSPSINRLTGIEAEKRILDYLKQHGKVRRTEMVQDLDFTLTRYLRKLVAIRILNKVKEGKKVFYSINPNYKPD